MKHSIKVQNWPFESLQNYLQLIFQVSGKSTVLFSNTVSTSSNTGSESELLWLKFNVDDFSLYPQEVIVLLFFDSH